MKIVLIRLRSLGDTILMTPVISVLKRDPENQVGIVVEQPFDQILRGNHEVDRIFRCRPRRKLLSRLKTVLAIRAFQPDLVIDLHGGTTSAWITRFSGAPRRVGYQSCRNAKHYNVKVPDSRILWGERQLHTVEHQLSPVKFLQYPVEPIPSLSVPVLPEALRLVRRQLLESGIEQPFLLMHPAAAFSTKQWPVERFAGLARALSREGKRVVLTAGPGQQHGLQRIQKEAGQQVAMVDPLPLPQFAALVSQCELYIGNDTGTTHLAAALGKPIVVIFGSSDSGAWHPWGVPYRLLSSTRACIPCPGYRCLHYDRARCIEDIEVEQAYQAVKELIRWNSNQS